MDYSSSGRIVMMKKQKTYAKKGMKSTINIESATYF